MFPITGLITVAWSLSYEMFFYLIVPLFLAMTGMKHWAGSRRVLLLIALAAFGLCVVVFGLDSHARLLVFLAGMLLYECQQPDCEVVEGKRGIKAIRYIARSPVPNILWVFAALLVCQHLGLPYFVEVMVLLVGYFMTCLQCFDEKNMFSRFCSLPFMRWYGNMSYSYYLIHGLTLKFLFMVMAGYLPPEHQWNALLYVLLLPFFAATWIVSTLLFICIEKPFSLLTKPGRDNVRSQSTGEL